MRSRIPSRLIIFPIFLLVVAASWAKRGQAAHRASDNARVEQPGRTSSCKQESRETCAVDAGNLVSRFRRSLCRNREEPR